MSSKQTISRSSQGKGEEVSTTDGDIESEPQVIVAIVDRPQGFKPKSWDDFPDEVELKEVGTPRPLLGADGFLFAYNSLSLENQGTDWAVFVSPQWEDRTVSKLRPSQRITLHRNRLGFGLLSANVPRAVNGMASGFICSNRKETHEIRNQGLCLSA